MMRFNPATETLEKIVYPVGSQSDSFGTKALACPPLEGRADGRIV
jgi:hypothetical protein